MTVGSLGGTSTSAAQASAALIAAQAAAAQKAKVAQDAETARQNRRGMALAPKPAPKPTVVKQAGPKPVASAPAPTIKVAPSVSYNTGTQDSPQPAAANPTALAQLNLLGRLPEEQGNLALGALQTNFGGGFNDRASSPNPPSGRQGPGPNPPTGSPLPLGSAPPQGTVNIGIAGNLNVPIIGPVGLGGTGFTGFAYDGTHWAWYRGVGGGVGVGASGSLGIQIGGSNAKSVSDLSGPFGFGSVSGGEELVVGVEGYTGRGSQGQSVTGGNGFIGVGVGTPVSGTAGGTYTWVDPIG